MSEHYKYFPTKFEPYKICNNANFNGNLQQVFQYVVRRKWKNNEIADLQKALDFLKFEKERRDTTTFFYKVLGCFFSYFKYGFFVFDRKLSKDFYNYCEETDWLLSDIYFKLVNQNYNTLDEIREIITNEIKNLKQKQIL